MLGFLIELEIVHWVVGGWVLECCWEGFWHTMCWGPVGVGVVVWVGSVGVGVGFAMSCCVCGADADFVGGSSLMVSIGTGSVSV